MATTAIEKQDLEHYARAIEGKRCEKCGRGTYCNWSYDGVLRCTYGPCLTTPMWTADDGCVYPYIVDRAAFGASFNLH